VEQTSCLLCIFQASFANWLSSI